MYEDEVAGGDYPVLPISVQLHLGQVLAAAYSQVEADAGNVKAFADLLGRLDVALTKAGKAADKNFQAALLGAVPGLRRFAMSLTHDRIAAEDLIQETLMRAWRNRHRFDLATNIEAWTFTILRNQFYTNARKARETQDQDGALAARMVALPDQIDHLDVADVQTALATLAPEMREALMLVTVSGLPYEEVASIQGCRVGTVKSRVWRARDQLVRTLGYDRTAIGQDPITLSAMEKTV
ncbi:sigma-70 family RNA polymerase sigma factor [Methylobacterium radiotolerans]|uniref:sigma-70 family RNA polymerase sigma factor n=1 Tax=Methylobacterium radiotolerans TaxID=31998 RepID=UPI001F20506B|nr:sigma-70 family RNA polymerase sigma factor [Methylobacterium radiotolerans]UIY45640.1 sigma-70 family RNA polymerase sigma factor [Methylobacterium radiotolerans]